MLRSLALASALVVASLSASALSAQTSAAPSKPSPSATSHAPAVHAKADSGSTSAMNKSMTWTTDQIKEAQGVPHQKRPASLEIQRGSRNIPSRLRTCSAAFRVMMP